MPNPLDLTGNRFGRLVAIERSTNKKKQTMWLCRCDCGKEKSVALGALRSGLTRSCRCLHDEVSGSNKYIDLTGMAFGDWFVIKQAGIKKNQAIYWLCRCKCGQEVAVHGGSLRKGKSTCCVSCAYIKIAAKNKNIKLPKEQREHLSKIRMGRFTGKDNPNWKGGITPEKVTIRCSLEYEIWRNEVFQRDRWTCQKCGNKPQKIHAHHKEPFYRHRELRFDVNNGITLCEPCHREEHRKPFTEWGQT